MDLTKIFYSILLLWMLTIHGTYGSCSNPSHINVQYEVQEEQNPPAFVANIDNDLNSTFGAPYQNVLFTFDTESTFHINYNTGLIQTKTRLDRETKDQYKLFLGKASATICIAIVVTDVNDKAPTFSPESYREVDILEGTPLIKIFLGSAVDEDIGANSIAGYRLASGNDDYTFYVNGGTSDNKLLLHLGVNGTVDYDTTSFYSLTIEVFDGGSPALTSTMTVNVNILDANDNSPIFNQSKYSTAIYENTTVGASILEVHATDQDSNENGRISYTIAENSDPDNLFSIDAETGVVTLNKMLDYELKRSYRVFTVASDHGNQSLSTQAVLEIDVLNINELPAEIFIAYSNNTPRILENASIGDFVARVSVSDPESPEAESDNIAVTLHGGDGKFSLNKSGIATFSLNVAGELDRETKSSYNLTLVALDAGSPPLSATLSFLLQVDDANDNAPVFQDGPFEAYVNELSEAGSYVLSVSAVDSDINENARISYSISSNGGANSDWFEVSAESGLITTRGQIDCEVDSQPSFWLVATDHGTPQLSSSVYVTVSVRDVNDKEPTFETSLYTASVPENITVNSCILQVNATDPDCGVNGRIHYSLDGPTNNFQINDLTGEICVILSLDHELFDLYEFSVIATDSGDFSTTANVQVSVQDINDNVPIFYPRNYSKNIHDSTQPQSEIITVHATDEDSGLFGRITYSIMSGNADNKFHIDPTSGIISVQQSLPNGETVYKLLVGGVDGGGVETQQPAEVYISVTGPRYNPPVFQQTMYRYSISEAVQPNTVVGTVQAAYAGSYDGITYSILSGDRHSFFRINMETGEIQTAKVLDHDQFPTFLLGVQADTGSTHLFGSTQVEIIVEDENDNIPMFSKTEVTISVSEATSTSVTIYSAHAADIDSKENGNGEVRYSLKMNSDNLFVIDATTGDIYLAQGLQLDYETKTQHTLVILATDQGQTTQLSSSMTLLINVQDANDNPPVFVQSHFVASVNENAKLSFQFKQINATDRDIGENGRITYTLLPSEGSDQFGIFPSNGQMYLRKRIDYEEMSEYMFTVVARDHGQPSKSTTAQVTIYIEDYNDNRPIFLQDHYQFYIEENLPSGTVVGTVSATDLDTGSNQLLRYDFLPSQGDFSISGDGVIYSSRRLDREIKPNYSVQVWVRDSGNPVLESKVQVDIGVTDVNDHSPEILNSPLTASIEENLSKGVRVVRIVAKDTDEGVNGSLSFSLSLINDDSQQDALDCFTIHPTSGWITTTEVLDYEVKKLYKLQVVVSDAGTPPMSTARELEIRVIDDMRNDETPTFPSNSSITFYVVENVPIGTQIGQVQAYDKDAGENGRVSYYIVSGNIFSLFSVDMNTGYIYTIRDIDYEETSKHTVGIKAIDNSVYNPKSSVITIRIEILDINDNPPQFDVDPVFLKLKENLPVSTVIYTFTATDPDSDDNGTVTYSIGNQSGNDHLEINPQTGQLMAKRNIDYEQITEILLIIEARDQAPTSETQLKTHVTVIIQVEDINDNAPVFQSYPTIKVNEDEPVGYQVVSIIATDADSNINNSRNSIISYSILAGNEGNAFVIEQNTGALTISSRLHYEVKNVYSLRIEARDQGHPSHSAEMTLTLQVVDVNDHAPEFSQQVYQANISESKMAGSIVIKVMATDADAGNNSKLTYMIPDGVADNLFDIEPVTGLITLATSDIDRETKSSYIVNVYVQDAGDPVLFDMATLIVNITDENDNPPQFKDSRYSLEIPENIVQDAIYTFVAQDADIGDNAKITYRIASGNVGSVFLLDMNTGVLSLVRVLDRETRSNYTLTISASDNRHTSACEVLVTVQDENDNYPVFDRTVYRESVYENVAVGTTILNVTAIDIDSEQNGEVTYSLYNDSEDASLFSINATTGVITSKGLFDRERKSSYSFNIEASDDGIYNRHSEHVQINIQILDINDNAPVFREVPYRKSVSENVAANTLLLTVTADDQDSGLNKLVTYRLLADTSSQNYFKIDASSGEIRTRVILGGDAIGYHNLRVTAADSGDSPLTSTGFVEISVGQVNNNLQFSNNNYTTTLQEHANIGTTVIRVQLDTPSSGVTFNIASGNQNGAFNINNQGVITVAAPDYIDYEVETVMKLIVSASVDNKFAYTTVWLEIDDINDNYPIFSKDRYTTKFHEEQIPNTFVIHVTASDADSYGPNSEIVYRIVSGNHGNVFVIDPPESGIIKSSVFIDYEVRRSYKLIIEGKDKGAGLQLSNTCTVKIAIIDMNDNAPYFPTSQPQYFSENTDIGTVVATLTANDIDSSSSIVYNFSTDGNPDSMFNLDRYSGIIRLAKNLDYEGKKHYRIGLKASDGLYETSVIQDVFVTDENDHSPQFDQQSYRVILEELLASGSPVVTVSATDADDGDNARITYSITLSEHSQKFSINPQSGAITINGSIQYTQNQKIIQLVVVASDNGEKPLSAVASVYIQVTSVNKYTPEFKETSYSAVVSEDVEPGYIVLHHVTAVDQDIHARNREIDYYLMGGNIHNNFVIDQKNGSIIVNTPLDRERVEEYNLIVMARDRGIPSKNSTVTVHILVLDVNDESPYFEFNEYSVVLNESYPNDTQFLKIQTFDNDTGANAKIYHLITSGNENGIFIIGGSTGDLYIMPNTSLDYEQHTYHKLIVKITDCLGCDPGSPQLMNVTTVHVNVTDVNEYSPEFPSSMYVRGVEENLPIGSSVFEAHANDKDGGDFGVVEYRLEGSLLFSIHYSSGVVTNNQMFDYENTQAFDFQFDIIATDKGGRSTSIPVHMFIVDMDEFAPVFKETSYAFEVPGKAKKGTIIGQVSATDSDGGIAGKVVYSLQSADGYFSVNASTGQILVAHDLNKEIVSETSRKKRDVKEYMIVASSGMDDSQNATISVSIDVDRACGGCEMQYITMTTSSPANAQIQVVIIVVVVVLVIALALLAVIGLILYRRKYGKKTPPPSETPMYDNDEFDNLSHVPTKLGNGLHHDVVRLDGHHEANTTTSSDRSGSSGRGSAEDDEDEELVMINSSSPSYLNNSNGLRKIMPDSGIQDDDNTSEPSVQNHQDYLARLGIDTSKIDSKTKCGLGHSVESMHQFSDSGGGEGTGLDIAHIDYTKLDTTHTHQDSLMDKHDLGFHEPDPNMGGSLSNVINSEEEYSGSYNWDYLLDWGPQYQPLAHVFSEIARLKDDSFQPKKQAVKIVQQQRQVTMNVHPRINPPPMITNTPPQVLAQPVSRSTRSSHSSAVSTSNRNSTINTSLPSMPRSPISHESSFTSPALTPSFTPSLSPLATRSPSVSPVNSGRGQVTPRSRHRNNDNNNQFVFSSSSSEQELRI